MTCREEQACPGLGSHEKKKSLASPQTGKWDGIGMGRRGGEHVVAHVVPHVPGIFTQVCPWDDQQKEALWKGKTSYLQVRIDSGVGPNQGADRFEVPGASSRQPVGWWARGGIGGWCPNGFMPGTLRRDQWSWVFNIVPLTQRADEMRTLTALFESMRLAEPVHSSSSPTRGI